MNDSNWQDWRTRPSRRPRRLEEASTIEVGFPIAWVLIGGLSGLLVLGLIGLGVVNILRRSAITPTPPAIPGVVMEPTQSPDSTPPPTNDAQGVPANATPTIPPVVTLPPTETPTPTVTPIPTLPDALAENVYAQVTNTDGFGASMRAGPGTNNARLAIAREGSIVYLVEGPRDDENLEDYTWWLIRAEDGTEGWTVEQFLIPSLPPGAN